MDDKKKTEANEAVDTGLDIDVSMFITEEGANMLSTEQLNEINKVLPKWSIEPPSKYKK